MVIFAYLATLQSEKLTGAALKFQQLKALLIKRFHHYKRDVRNYITQIILPCLFILLAMGCALIKSENSSMPSLLLTPDLYESPTDHRKLTLFFRLAEFIVTVLSTQQQTYQ